MNISSPLWIALSLIGLLAIVLVLVTVAVRPDLLTPSGILWAIAVGVGGAAAFFAGLNNAVHLVDRLRGQAQTATSSNHDPGPETHPFTPYVHIEVVVNFIPSGNEQGSEYREIMSGTLDAAGWKGVLQEAVAAGLVNPTGNRAHEVHPSLPSFLRQRQAVRFGAEALERTDREFMRYYAAWSSHFFEAIRKREDTAVNAAGIEEQNLLRALGIAETCHAWGEAQAIVQTLDEFYEMQNRDDERDGLRQRLLDHVGYELPPGASRDRASLWMFLLGNQANQALLQNDLDSAQAMHERILGYLLGLDNQTNEPKVAVAHHQLGIIAQQRGQLDQAEAWYRKALGISERLGLQRDAAATYHQLGMVTQERGQLDQAEAWYRKALEIYNRLGLERDAAGDYHQLGIVAQQRGQLDQAESWYCKALEIRGRLGLERDAATDYHQLGMVAEERQQFDQAEAWYRRALETYQRLGIQREAAGGYHQLGIVAQQRGQLDQAESWYCKALEIRGRLGLERDAATDYHQLGMVAQERAQLDEAETWYRKALEIYERLMLERDAAADYHQLGMVAEERGQLNQAEAWYHKALEIKERFGLERSTACDYHHLGIVAEKREQFDQAEAWYRRALEIYDRLGHPPSKVNTLAQMGVLLRKQDRTDQAVVWLGRALAIASQYHMRVAAQILVDIARLMQAIGEEAFVASWTRSFPDNEPPLQVLRDILKQLESRKG